MSPSLNGIGHGRAQNVELHVHGFAGQQAEVNITTKHTNPVKADLISQHDRCAPGFISASSRIITLYPITSITPRASRALTASSHAKLHSMYRRSAQPLVNTSRSRQACICFGSCVTASVARKVMSGAVRFP